MSAQKLLALAALAAILGCSSSPGTDPSGGTRPGAKKRIILLTNGNSPFWDACRFGLEAGEKDYHLADAGLSVAMDVNDGTPKGQIDKLRQFATQADIVGVAVSALDADNAGVAQEMRNLRSKGIHVICVDADVNRQTLRDSRAYYIGTDNIIGGRALGTAAREILKSKGVTEGSYAQFVGRVGSHNARERMDGFKEAVGEAYREADRMGDDLNRTRARDNVRNAITNHPDLVALVGIWSYNAPAIVDVVKERKSREKYVIPTFDAEPIAIQQMQQGQIDVMIVQNPFDMGYLAVRLLKAMHEGDEDTIKEMFPNEGESDGDLLDTGIKVVVPNEGSPLTEEMFGNLGRVDFMRLAAFQEWLQKYDLPGS